MKNVIVWSLLSALLAGTAACGPSVNVATPPGFAVLDKQKEYVYRAMSADNVVLGVRAEKNDPAGPLDFWADALDRQLRQGGYKADGAAQPVRSAGGLQGRLQMYTRDHNGRAHRFWVAIFVTESRVWVVEAGGDAERFKDKKADGVKKAIESMVFN